MNARTMHASKSSVPGFFGLRRPQPDIDRYRKSYRSKAHPWRLPKPLIARYRSALSPAAHLLRKRQGAASIEQRLVDRITMGWTAFEQEQIEENGYRNYLETQLHPENIDDFGLEEAIEDGLPSITMTPAERLFNYYEDAPEVPYFELLLATTIRAIFSPRQLFERLVVFWSDHFNTHFLSDFGIWLKPSDDRHVIRQHALGTFPDLLRASAHSPAMLEYLTNNSNVVGHPNENYARELMELHTLGVDGGYSEDDVREVARCFTGWTFLDGDEAGVRWGQFFFDPTLHDNGAKTVLGHTIPAGGGRQDGETVLDILAAHPSTARFIGEKLLRYLWGYQPDAPTVDRIARLYLNHGGDIRSMVRGSMAWYSQAVATPKLKRPYHLIVSAVRALFAEVEDPFFLLQAMLDAGQLPFNWAPPNGYPDSEGYWSGFVLPRWNFGMNALAAESGLVADLSFLDPSLPVEELRTLLDVFLLNGTMSAATRDTVDTFLNARPIAPARIRDALGLVLASPDFQRY